MTVRTDDQITALIALMRKRQHAQALRQAKTLIKGSEGGETEPLGHCKQLAQWYLAAMEGRGAEGLSDAVTAVARLSDAGWREQLGFAYGSLGFVFAMLGDFETGLEWLEVAIRDAERANDREQLAGCLSQKGGVLGFAEEWTAAFDCFTRALELAGPGEQPVIHPIRAGPPEQRAHRSAATPARTGGA